MARHFSRRHETSGAWAGGRGLCAHKNRHHPIGATDRSASHATLKPGAVGPSIVRCALDTSTTIIPAPRVGMNVKALPGEVARDLEWLYLRAHAVPGMVPGSCVCVSGSPLSATWPTETRAREARRRRTPATSSSRATQPREVRAPPPPRASNVCGESAWRALSRSCAHSCAVRKPGRANMNGRAWRRLSDASATLIRWKGGESRR